MKPNTEGLKVNVQIKDMDIFKEAVEHLKEIYQREDVPQDIKNKIEKYIKAQDNGRYRRNIICQNCGALLVDFSQKGSSHIHLGMGNINIEDKGLITLMCNCGCKIQYKQW